MSDEKTYTELDLIVAKRGAYIEGALADHNATGWVREMGRVEREAHEKYPLPKVTRPRVANDPHLSHVQWRAVDDQIEVLSLGEWKRPDASWGVHSDRVRLWADLLQNPVEEVEE